jgi:RNA polymerase sigma-70 factor (ECF subfamily)
MLQAALGFVPRVFRAQAASPVVLEAEIEAARALLLDGKALTPMRRELVLLAFAAARLDPYSCALHSERLTGMGVPAETVEDIVAGRGTGALSEGDAELVRFAEDLGTGSSAPPGGDRERLEAVAAAAFGAFLGALAAGLGVRPDFRTPRTLLEERRARTAAAPAADDPDATLVAAARSGDAAAFEELLRRHQARVYRTIAGLTGDAAEAEDGSQAVFLRAFRGLGEFAGAARFATWLTRIAIREGIDRVRRRHPTESLEELEGDDDFRPALVDPWVDDPERLYAREEMRRLVRQELSRLPVLYRAAVMLRDIEQLSTAEAAAALELPVPTLKTRLLRGRLLLREALSAHFSQGAENRRV